MGNSYSAMGGDGRLQTSDTYSSGKKFYTNLFCVGCGCHNEVVKPVFAGEFKLCCLESGTRVDFSHCDQATDLCACRAGCKTGPAIGEVKNPLIDNHELIVVLEKNIADCGHSKKVDGVTQASETRISGKSYHTNCGCVGCGCSNDLCRPALAGDFRLCCLESGTRVDCGDNMKMDDLCRCRAGCKFFPAVVDLKNPIVDNHELIVCCEKKVYGCK